MKYMHKTLAATLTCTIFAFGVIGCSSAKVDHGRTNQVPQDVRGPVEHGQLGSKELDNTTDVMLTSIVASIDHLRRGEDGRSIIVLDHMVNKTHRPTQDLDIFLAQLRRKLNTSGIKYQIVFVENPRDADAMRNRVLEDSLKDDYDTPGLRPHYALTGDVYSIDERGGRYWELFFRLTDLDPNNPIRNEIRWENSAGFRFAR